MNCFFQLIFITFTILQKKNDLTKRYTNIIFLLSVCILQISGQTFYTENFNNGCTAGCLATGYGSWTVQDNVGGTNGGSPNIWYVSCAEEGITPPGCGSSCIGDACLHIGADAGGGGDGGASFNETGVANRTYRLARSPVINGTGKTGIILQFDFIAYGSASCSNDRAQLWLSDNGGATWPVGYQFCLTSVCCGACNGYSQGQWTTYTYTLPVAFNNNANIRIGFHWRNDGNGAGTDPSVAIDDIRLRTPVALPINLLDFYANKLDLATIQLNWNTVAEKDFSHFEIERSPDAQSFSKIGSANSKGGQSKVNYLYNDKSIESNNTYYYRLKMVDKDGSYAYSKIVTIGNNFVGNADITLASSLINENTLRLDVYANTETTIALDLYDVKGKKVITTQQEILKPGTNKLSIDVNHLNAALYLLKVSKPKSDKPELSIITQKVVKAN